MNREVGAMTGGGCGGGGGRGRTSDGGAASQSTGGGASSSAREGSKPDPRYACKSKRGTQKEAAQPQNQATFCVCAPSLILGLPDLP